MTTPPLPAPPAPPSAQAPRKGKQFEFDGGAASYFGTGLLAFLITVFTLGIMFPFALVLRERWRAKHSFIDGHQMEFNGLATGLFGLWIKWLFLIIITLGIYSFWVGPRIARWKWNHTAFKDHVLESRPLGSPDLSDPGRTPGPRTARSSRERQRHEERDHRHGFAGLAACGGSLDATSEVGPAVGKACLSIAFGGSVDEAMLNDGACDEGEGSVAGLNVSDCPDGDTFATYDLEKPDGSKFEQVFVSGGMWRSTAGERALSRDRFEKCL